MSNSFQSSSLALSTTYYNVSVLTTRKNSILRNPPFVLPDYNLMQRIENL